MALEIPLDRYPFAMVVPEAGASCATCYFVSKDGKTCRNRLYAQARGSNEIPTSKPSRWCCDLWTPPKESL